ncbi:MAG: hypothetical protein AAF710_12505 [Planctomycetota bacterium]
MFDPDQLPVPDLGLSCVGCGYPLAFLEEHRCPECGRAFTLDEHVPTGDDAPPLFAGGEAVHATPEIVALLEAYQVPFVRLRGHFDAALGSYSGTILSQPAPPIGVPPGCYLEAIDLIRRLTQGEPMPELPTPYAEGHDWVCDACGEANPSNFGVCWSCQAPRDPAGSA